MAGVKEYKFIFDNQQQSDIFNRLIRALEEFKKTQPTGASTDTTTENQINTLIRSLSNQYASIDNHLSKIVDLLSIKGTGPVKYDIGNINDISKSIESIKSNINRLSKADLSKEVSILDLETGPINKRSGKFNTTQINPYSGKHETNSVEFINQVGIIKTTLENILTKTSAELRDIEKSTGTKIFHDIKIKPTISKEAYEASYADIKKKKPDFNPIDYDVLKSAGIDFKDAMTEAGKILKDSAIIAGHNLEGFDKQLIEDAFKEASINIDLASKEYYDTLKEARKAFPGKEVNLPALRKALEDSGRVYEGAVHDATADIAVTADVMKILAGNGLNLSSVMDKVSTEIESMVDKFSKVGKDLSDASISAVGALEGMGYTINSTSNDLAKAGSSAMKSLNATIDYSDKAVLRMKDLSKARSSIQSAIFESQPVYPISGDPTKGDSLRYRQVVTKGFDETKNANLVKSLESLSTSLNKLQNNIVKSLEQGLRNGWKVLEGDQGEKFKLSEGNREWELTMVNVDKLRQSLSKSNINLGPGATAAQAISEYKSVFKKDELSKAATNESIASEVGAWLLSATKGQLASMSDTTKNLADLIKSGKLSVSDLSNNKSLRDIYSSTVLEAKATESLRSQFLKSISVPAANVSAQGTLGFDTKYGAERSVAKFATITTGLEKLAEELRDLGGGDRYHDFMERLSKLPFRIDKSKDPEKYETYSKLADELLGSVKSMGGKGIVAQGLQSAINLRLEERNTSTQPIVFDTMGSSIEELEKKAKDLGITAVDVAKALDNIEFENFYDILDRLYQTGRTPFITEKAYGISGSESERSIRDIAKIKDELLGAMPLVEPGRSKRRSYDEEVVKILTRQISSGSPFSENLRPEEQKKHIVDVALTWQEIADNLKKLNPQGESLPTARPIDLSDSASSQISEFNSKSTSALKDLNKVMVSASTADIRAMAPFEKFSSISRQMSYSANALAGKLPGGDFELPSLVSEKERGMIESGKYGTGGYGLNVLTELRNTAGTFEDQIIISGRLAEAFTRIVKPLVGPAASIVQDIKPMEAGKTVALSGKGHGLLKNQQLKGADPAAFEKMVKEVTNQYQEVLGVPKTYAGRADIAQISDEIQNVMRVHRGESIEVQTAKLTETFMNYFGRKLSTRFGTKGVSITPPKVPTEIKELQDIATAMSAGLEAKVVPGAGIGFAKMPKSAGSMLSEMISSKISKNQVDYSSLGLDEAGLKDLSTQLEKSGNKFIIDLFNDASYGLVTKEEAAKQKRLLEDATEVYAELFSSSLEFESSGALKLRGRSLKSGTEGIQQLQEGYYETTGKSAHELRPIEARISSRGIAKRGLMPEVLEGLVNNLIGTTAESTTIKNADITNNEEIKKKINEYLSALDFKGLTPEEKTGVEKRLRAEMGNKPGSDEAIKKVMDFEKDWSVYTDTIDEYGKQLQSFVAPKFLQIVEEPNLYKEWNPNEIDKGLRGEKLNFQAYAAYAGVFGEGSKMMEELSKDTSLTSREGWELIRAMQMLDPSMQQLTKTMMDSLETVKLVNIKPFDDRTATTEGLKGTIFDIGKYPAPFKIDIPSVNRKGEVSGFESMYIPGPSVRNTYPEELMGGRISPTDISRRLSNLVSAAQKVEDLLDISRKGTPGMDEETALKFSSTIYNELRNKLTDTYKQFTDIESKRSVTPENIDFMRNYVDTLKQVMSPTLYANPAYVTKSARNQRQAMNLGPQSELEAVNTYEAELKAQGDRNMYSKLLGRMMDMLIGPNPESLNEEERQIAAARKQYKENPATIPSSYAKKFESQRQYYKNDFNTMLDAYQKRIDDKRAIKSKFDVELAAGNLQSFAEDVGLNLNITVKESLEKALDSLSRAKVSYYDELSKSVLGPKHAIEQTFFQRVIPSSVTAKAVTAITDKTDELASSLDKLKNIRGIPASVISSLEEIKTKHEDYIKRAGQLGMPVLKEGEIGIHPDMAKQIKVQQAGRDIDLAKMMSDKLEEAYVSTVRYPFTGTLSVQSHKAKLMENDLYRHSLAVPGAPEMDIASMQLDVLAPLNKRIEDIMGEREQAWSSGSSDKAKSLTDELENLLRIVKDLTPKFTNMEQKLDFDGDALFLHTGQVEDSRKEIASHFNAMGKDLTSVRSLFNTVFSAVKETDAKSLSEMAYIFSKKHPSEKGFSFLDKPYIEKDVSNLNMSEIFKALSTYSKVDTKNIDALDAYIKSSLEQDILPEVFRKAGGTEEQRKAFGEKAVASFSGGGTGIPLGPDAGEFEITANKLLEELVRRKLWEQKYSDSIVGQLYKLHTGQTVEGISRVARMSEIETGFGMGMSKSGKNIFEPSKEFLSKWPKESVALGFKQGMDEGKPVEEFATRMNEIMRFVIQKGLDEKHAGVEAVGKHIISNVGKKGGAAAIMKIMVEESKQFDDLWNFNDEIVKSAKIRLGALSLDELRSEVKKFEPNIVDKELMGLSRADIIGNPKSKEGYRREDAGKIIPHIDLQAVFEELFRMVERQAIKGFIKATQEELKEAPLNKRAKIESDVARSGGFENYAKAEIARKAASENGISILKYVTTNLEPLYKLRTSMETSLTAGARSYIKPDASGLSFTEQTKNADLLRNTYTNSIKAAHTLSRYMQETVPGAQGGAHSLMVLSAVQKRMDELDSILTQASQLGIPTTQGAPVPTTTMGYANEAYTAQASKLFADIWQRANIDNARVGAVKDAGPIEEMNAQIERMNKVMGQTKDELANLSQTLGIPMMGNEEEQSSFFKFNQENPNVLPSIDIRSKMLSDELSAKYPEKIAGRSEEIKTTTETYTEFMHDLLKFQIAMSEQARRVSEAMKAVPFQKSYLETSFPGISAFTGISPIDLANEKTLNRQEERAASDKALVQERENRKELILEHLSKQQQQAFTQGYAEAQPQITNKKPTVGEYLYGPKWSSQGVGGIAAGGAAGGGGGGLPPGGRKPPGGGGPDDPYDEEKIKQLLDRLRQGSDISPEEWTELMTAYIETINKAESDIFGEFKTKYTSLISEIQSVVDPKFTGGFESFKYMAQSISKAKQVQDRLKSVADKISDEYDTITMVTGPEAETAEGMHLNLKSLLDVAKFKHKLYGGYDTSVMGGSQEIADLVKSVSEQGPSSDLAGKIREAVDKLPTSEKGSMVSIWKYYRKAVGEYFIKELDRLRSEIDNAKTDAAGKEAFGAYRQTIKRYRETIIDNLGKPSDIYTEKTIGKSKGSVHPALAQLTGTYRTPDEIMAMIRERNKLSSEYEPVLGMLIGSTDADAVEGLLSPIEKVRQAFESLTSGAADVKRQLKDDTLFKRFGDTIVSQWDFTKTIDGITQLRAGLESWNHLQLSGDAILGANPAYTEAQRTNIMETIKLLKQLEKAFIPTGGTAASEMGLTGVPTFLSADEQEALHKRNIAATRNYFSKTPEEGGPERGTSFTYRYKMVDPATKQVVKNIAEEFRSLGTAVDSAGQKIGVFSQKGEDLLKAFQDRKGFGQALGRVIRWGAMSSLVWGTVSALKDMVNTISDVELGIANLRQVMSPLETNFDEITSSAVNFAKEFGMPIRQVVDSMKVFAQQGLSQAEVIDRTRTSALAANVTTLSTTDATEALTAAAKAYSEEGQNSIRFLDAWSQVEAAHAVTAADLANALQKAGAAAKTSGVSFDQFNALVTGIGETSRMPGKEVGTSLRFIFRRLQAEEGPKQLGKVGISTLGSTGDIRSSFDILGELYSKWGELSQAQKLNIAQSIGGTRHYNALIILMEHWGDVLDALHESVNSKGAAERRNAIVMDTYAKKLEQVRAAMTELQVEFGKFALPIAKGALTGIKALLEVIANVPSSVKIAFVSIGSLFTLLTKGGDIIDKISASFTSSSNIFGDFIRSMKSELSTGVYEVFGKSIGGISLEGLFKNIDTTGLKQFNDIGVTGLGSMESGIGKSIYLVSKLGRAWNNVLTDITKGGASTTSKIADIFDSIGDKLVKKGGEMAVEGGPLTSFVGAASAALGSASEVAGYGTEKIAKVLGLTSEQMAKLTNSSTGVVGALAPMVGSFFALKPLLESTWDSFKKLALSAGDYEKSMSALKTLHSGELANIDTLIYSYDKFEKRLADINASTRPEVKSRLQEREEYKSPLHELGKLYGDATEYGNKLSETNIDLISGFDQFGNAILKTTDNMKGYLDVMASAQRTSMAETDLGIMGAYIKDLTKTAGMETFKNELKKFISEIPVIGETLAQSIKVSPAKSLEELRDKISSLMQLRNEYPLTTAFDIDLTNYNKELAKARESYKETYNDFKRVLNDIPTEGLNPAQITEMLSRPEFREGFDVIANIEPRLQVGGLKGKLSAEDILGGEILKKVYPGKPLDFTAQLTKGLLEQSNIKPRDAEAFAGDIVLFTDDIANKYEVAGNQAILKMQRTSEGIVKWTVQYFDKELLSIKELPFDKVSNFVDSIFPVQAISDRLYENIEVLKEFVAGAGAGLRGITQKTFKKDFNLGERFYSQLPTTTLLQTSQGFEPGKGFGNVGFKTGWDKWIEENFFKPMTEYNQLLEQLKPADLPTGESELSPGLTEDISKLQDVLKNNQVVLQYRAVHEDLIKTLSEGERILEENIEAERNRSKYIVQNSGYLKGFAEDMSDVSVGVQKYADLTAQQRLSFAEGSRGGVYTTARQSFKEGTIERQSIVDSINNIDKSLIAVREIGEVARSFGAALPTSELSNYMEEIAKTGDRGTGLLLGETQKVVTNTSDTVTRLDQLLEQGGDESTINNIISKLNNKNDIVDKLESLTEKRNKAAKQDNTELVTTYDRAIDKLTSKLIDVAGPEKALKAVKSNAPLFFGSQDFNQAEFIKRALGNTNFEGFSKALERVQPGITKTKEFSKLIALQNDQSTEQIVSNKNLNKLLAVYSTIEHFNKVSSTKQIDAINEQITTLKTQGRDAESAGTSTNTIAAQIKELEDKRSALEIKAQGQAMREIIAPVAIASQELVKSFGVTDNQIRILGGTVGSTYLAWKAWEKLTGEPTPDYLKELGGEAAKAAEEMSQGGIKGTYAKGKYAIKDLVFGEGFDKKLKDAEDKIKSERVLTDEEVNKAKESIIYGGEKAEDSEVKRAGKPENLGQAIRRAMEHTKAESKAKSMSSEDKILDENSAQTGILSGIYEQVKRTAENTIGFSGNLSEEIKAGREDRKDETDAIIANVDKIRSEYLAKNDTTRVNPINQLVAALLAATATGYVADKSERRGRNNELEDRAEDQVDLIDEIIKKYPDSIAKAIEDFNTTIATAGTTAPIETEKVQKAADTEAAEKDMIDRLQELRTRMAEEYDKVNDAMEESAKKIANLQLAEEMKKQLEDLDSAIKSSQAIKNLEKRFSTPTSGLLAGTYTPQLNLNNNNLLDMSPTETLSMTSDYERAVIGKINKGMDSVSNTAGSVWESGMDKIANFFHAITFKLFKDTYSDMANEYESGTAELAKLMETASSISTEMTQIQSSPMTDESKARYEALEDNLSVVTERMSELNESLTETATSLQKVILAEGFRLRTLKSTSDAAADFALNYAQSTTPLSPFGYLGKQGLGAGGLNLQLPGKEEDITAGERALLEARKANNKELERALLMYAETSSRMSAQSQQSNELSQDIARNRVEYDSLSNSLSKNDPKLIALKDKIEAQVKEYDKLRETMGKTSEELKRLNVAQSALNLGQLINDLTGIKKGYANETRAREFKDISAPGIDRLMGGSSPLAKVQPTYAAIKAGVPEDMLYNMDKYQMQMAEAIGQEGPGPTIEQLNAISVTKQLDIWAEAQRKQDDELKRQQGLSVDAMTAVANAIERAQGRGVGEDELSGLRSLLSTMQKEAKVMTDVTSTENGIKMYKGFQGDKYIEDAKSMFKDLDLGSFDTFSNNITSAIQTGTDRIVSAILEGKDPYAKPEPGWISKLFGFGDATVEGKATGGFITGPGGPREDRVLKAMSPGEYVLKASSTKNLVRKYGPETLHSINQTGDLPKFAEGGSVEEEIIQPTYGILSDEEGFAKRQAEQKVSTERRIEALKAYTGDYLVPVNKPDRPSRTDEMTTDVVFDKELGSYRKKVNIDDIMAQVQAIIDTQESRNKSIDIVAKAQTAKDMAAMDEKYSVSGTFKRLADDLGATRKEYEGKGFDYSKDKGILGNLKETGAGIGSNAMVLLSGLGEAVPRFGEWSADMVSGLVGLGKTVATKAVQADTYKEGYKNIMDFWSKEGALKEAASLTGEAGVGIAKGVGKMFTGLAEGDIKSAFDIASLVLPIKGGSAVKGASKLGLVGKITKGTSAAVKDLEGIGIRSGMKKTLTGMKDIVKGARQPMSSGFLPGAIDIAAGLTETAIGGVRLGKNVVKNTLKVAGIGAAGTLGLGALATYGVVKGGIGLGKSAFKGLKGLGKGIADTAKDAFGEKGGTLSRLYKEVSEVSGKGPKKEIAKKWKSYYKDRNGFEKYMEDSYKEARASLTPKQLDEFVKEINYKRTQVLDNPTIVENAKTQFMKAKSKVGATLKSIKDKAKATKLGGIRNVSKGIYDKTKGGLKNIGAFAKNQYGNKFADVKDLFKASMAPGNAKQFMEGLKSTGKSAFDKLKGMTVSEVLDKTKSVFTKVKASSFIKKPLDLLNNTILGKGLKFTGGSALSWLTPLGPLKYLLKGYKGYRYLKNNPNTFKNLSELFNIARKPETLSYFMEGLKSTGKGMLGGVKVPSGLKTISSNLKDLYKFFDTGSLMEGLKSTITHAFGGLKDKSSTLFDKVKSPIGGGRLTAIKDMFSKNPFSDNINELLSGKNIKNKVGDYINPKVASMTDKLSGYRYKLSFKKLTDLFKKKGKKDIIDISNTDKVIIDGLYGADESVIKSFADNLNKISESASTASANVNTSLDTLLKEYGAGKITGSRNPVSSSDAMSDLLKEYGIGTSVKQASKPLYSSADSMADEILKFNAQTDGPMTPYAFSLGERMKASGSIQDNMQLLKDARDIISKRAGEPTKENLSEWGTMMQKSQIASEAMESLTGLSKDKAKAVVKEFLESGKLNFAGGGLVESKNYKEIYDYFNTEDAELPEWDAAAAKELIDIIYKSSDALDNYYLASDLKKIDNWKDFYNKILDYSDISDAALKSMPKPIVKEGSGYDFKGGMKAITGKTSAQQLKEIVAENSGGLLKGYAEGGTTDRSDIIKEMEKFSEEYKDYKYVIPDEKKEEEAGGIFSKIIDTVSAVKDKAAGARQTLRDKQKELANKHVEYIKTMRELSGQDPNTPFEKKYNGGLIQHFGEGSLVENEQYINDLMTKYKLKSDTEESKTKTVSLKDKMMSFINTGIDKTKKVLSNDTEHDTSVFKAGKDISAYKDRIEEIANKAKGGGIDSILAAVSPGEFIINRDSVRSIGQKYGIGALDFMNERGELPGFNAGGMINRYQFADGSRLPAAVPATVGSGEGINPQKIGDEIGESIAKKLGALEFKPVQLASDTISISDDSIKELEKALSKVNDGLSGGVGADKSNSKIDDFIEATNSRLETFAAKINEQDSSINVLSTSVGSISNLVTKDELSILSTQDNSTLDYKIHEAINFIEDRYLVGLRSDISLLTGRVSDLKYDLDNTRDIMDGNISQLGLRR